jgi:signal transduction histidine kinase
MNLLHLTIRQRLPLFISLSALFILMFEGYFIYEYSVRFHEQEFRDRIQKRLAEADSLIARDRLHPFTVINALPPSELPEEKILYATDSRQIVMPGGKRLMPVIMDTAQFHRCDYCFAHLGERDYGFRHDSVSHHTLVVSAVDRYGQSKLRNLRNSVISGVLLGVLLLALASWYWVKKMLQPIADKIKKARNIGAKSLNLRLNVKNDYDELGQLAQTFNEMLDRIEQGFRIQQQFIRNASHEMRTPLTAITAEADLALQQSRSPEHYRQALEKVRAQAENLNNLVAQLLLMARVETSRHSPEQSCAADEVLLAALQALHSKHPDAGQHIELLLDAPDPAQFLARCDPIILQAAFFNLLDNALKYGKGQPVSARLFPQGGSVCLEVADRGLGIAPEDMPRLFEPFYRSPLNQHLPGIGIGLSLVKAIADKYQGSLSLSSSPEQGTVVRFELPGA